MPGALSPLTTITRLVQLGQAIDARGRKLTYPASRGDAVHHYIWRDDVGRHLPIALRLPAAFEHLARVADAVGAQLTYSEEGNWTTHMLIWREQVGMIDFRSWSRESFLVHIANVLDAVGKQLTYLEGRSWATHLDIWREQVGNIPPAGESTDVFFKYFAKALDAIQASFTCNRFKGKFWTEKRKNTQVFRELPALLEEIAIFLDSFAQEYSHNDRYEWQREPFKGISSTQDPRISLKHLASVLRSIKNNILGTDSSFH